MNRKYESWLTSGVVIVIAAVCFFLFVAPRFDSDPTVSTGTSSTISTDSVADQTGAAPDAADSITVGRSSSGRIVAVDDLPPEAIDTLYLITDNGPYPYSKDGSTFQNREGRLPDEDRGYYREFTVETPGSRDRGARRIVAGDGRELYYTSDHYDSFSEIIGWQW